jgi:asparagine synthase (glutamine-hydrolysing)
MPGIVGIIGNEPAGQNASALGLMVKCMMHEPFYTSGSLVDRQLGVAIGWVCHAGSFADCMPIWNETKDVCLIFSGENFADCTEIDQLRVRGHQFRTDDASYLVHLYEEFGPKFLGKLNGRFSGLLLDLREQKVVLFNDRYGLGRIYYHETREGIYFASEAKALLKLLPHLRQLDPTSLGEFFSCGCALQNRTLFSGVSLLPGGSAWTIAPAQRTRKESYFRPEVWESQPRLGGAEYYEKLRETFPRVLRRYFRDNEQMAVSLTGGVDSRMIMAWANRPAGRLPGYTFAGMFREAIDVTSAREVARICEQPHQSLSVGREFLSGFPALAERTVYVSDGSMDITGTPDLYVNHLARQVAPIRLTGNYGGEILRSIVAFKPMSLHEGLFERELTRLVRTAAQTYSSELNERRLAFIAFKQVPWHHYARLSVELSQLTVRSPYLDNDLVALAFQVPLEHSTSNELSLRLIADGNPALGKIGTDRGLLYRSIPVVSKAANLYREFTFRAEYAYDYGMPHWLARLDRMLMPLHLERLFLGRHKFYHFRLWYRDELSQFVKDVLLDARSRSRPYVNGAFLEEMVNDHTSGRANYTQEIHRTLTCELIQRQLIEMN